MDRSEASRLLAKVFAYLAVGQPEKARPYAAKLVAWLMEVC
jgi:hypothetical protein